MERIFHPYDKWEDFKNGMYEVPSNKKNEKFIKKSIELLSNCDLFLNTCIDLINHWKIATEVNLTNTNFNRKAWLGHAACSYKFGCPEFSTRIAWGILTEKQRIEANNVAQKVINSFELNYEKSDSILY